MSLMNVKYVGSLRTEAKHLDSGSIIHTDAPKDNQGNGEKFSPTDLLCVSLASCIVTTMGIKARSLNVNMDGVEVDVKKIMTQTPPRKIAEVVVQFKWNGVDKKITPEQMESLKRSGEGCPVSLSLDPSVKKTVIW